MNSSQFSRSRLFLLVIPSSTFFQMRALSRTVTIEQLSRKIVQRYNRACQGVLDANFQGRILPLFYQISPEFFILKSHDHFIFSRLPNRKIKKFSLPLMYLIPFSAILKPTFPISSQKTWQSPCPEKALLDPYSIIPCRTNTIGYLAKVSIGKFQKSRSVSYKMSKKGN